MSRLSSRKLSVLVAVAIGLSLTAGVSLPHDGECAVLQRIAVDKVSTDGLPPGNYVLYVSDDSQAPQAIKLTIK